MHNPLFLPLHIAALFKTLFVFPAERDIWLFRMFPFIVATFPPSPDPHLAGGPQASAADATGVQLCAKLSPLPLASEGGDSSARQHAHGLEANADCSDDDEVQDGQRTAENDDADHAQATQERVAAAMARVDAGIKRSWESAWIEESTSDDGTCGSSDEEEDGQVAYCSRRTTKRVRASES